MSLRTATAPLVNDYFARLKQQKTQIEQRYRALTSRSMALFTEAGTILPGGYTRDAVMRNPHPTYLIKGQGSVVYDVDGRAINDFWFNATSLILGHNPPAVVGKVVEQMHRGTAFFGPTESELAHARTLLGRLPGADRVRYANSGSEAVMMALRIARGHTGRNLVAKFEGSYHGSYDDVAWSVSPARERLGPIESPAATAESGGLLAADGRILVLPFNDLERSAKLIETHATQIAAVILEPMANRIGLVLPDVDFVRGLRDLCDRFGIVLIFDEVIAFRVGYHGTQGILGVRPDLTTLGKIIGGGFPVGAVVGRAAVMDVTGPAHRSRVTHAGTFNANPITMVAGTATLEALTQDVFKTLNAKGERVRTELTRICAGLPLQVTGAGSLFKISATSRPISSYRDSVTADRPWEELASLELLNRGFLLTAAMQGCLSTATRDAQIDALLQAVADIVQG